VFTEKLQIHVWEVSKEKIDHVEELPSPLGAWTNFFYHSHLKSEEEMTMLLPSQPIVTRAYKKFQQFNRSATFRSLDETHHLFLHDLATDVDEAREKGKAEGKTERNIEIARWMKGEGFNTEVITRTTGLSSIEIERLD